MTGGRALQFPILAALLAAALAVSLMVGATAIPAGEVLDALLGGGQPRNRTIVTDLRLPRTILAALVGGSLGLCGAVFQALLRNPLAEPYILGVSGGAAVGAVGALVLGFSATSPIALPASAFAGAAVTVLLVLTIASGGHRGLDTRLLLLTGVIIGAFFNAVILLIITFASTDTFRAAIVWMMGSFSGVTWQGVWTLAAYVGPACAVLLVLARPLNLLSTGEQTAFYLGIEVNRLKVAAYLLASLTVAASVAVSGAIGFVGLVVPHAVRLLWGSDHRRLLPGSFLAGGAFLALADTAARTVVAPTELPVGVVTALVGVPIFLVLLVRNLS